MKFLKKTFTTLTCLSFLFACNTDRNDLIIKDLQNNGVDTSKLAPVETPNDNNDNDNNTTALGSQKIMVTVVFDSTFPKNVTSVKVRAFVSRSPIVVSTWVNMVETSGIWTLEYPAAPNAGTPFGLHIQAFNGSTRVADVAGSETEYPNNGDGSTITANTIIINTAL